MTHLDEGTIHAWLDGALSASEARDAQSHVDGCVECSAKVAEARGFIAGASRILTALDDIPAGVTPKRASSTAPAIRQWRSAWVTGIAAALVLAIGISTWKGEPDPALLPAPRAPIAGAAVADSVRARQPQAKTQMRAVATTSGAIVGGSRGAGVAEMASGAGTALRQAAPRADVQEPAGAAGATVATVSELAKKSEALPLPLPSAQASFSPSQPKSLADEAALARQRAKEAAGCYRIDVSSVRRSATADAIKAAAQEPVVVAAERRAVAASAPQPRLGAPASFVQLDTTLTPRGFIVRAVPTGERIGVWFRIRDDSLRVDELALGAFTIPTTARVSCP